MVSAYFGLPGCGKTTIMAKHAQKAIKRKIKVYSNVYIAGTYKFNLHSDLGKYDMSDSLILIDEATLEVDSRDFKKFSKELKSAFLLHRHYRCNINYYTQQYDGVDKKIRDITCNLYYLRILFFLTTQTQIYRKITITESDEEIKYGYRFPNFLEVIIGATRFHLRPRYYKFFDSWEAPELPIKSFEKW